MPGSMWIPLPCAVASKLSKHKAGAIVRLTVFISYLSLSPFLIPWRPISWKPLLPIFYWFKKIYFSWDSKSNHCCECTFKVILIYITIWLFHIFKNWSECKILEKLPRLNLNISRDKWRQLYKIDNHRENDKFIIIKLKLTNFWTQYSVQPQRSIF